MIKIDLSDALALLVLLWGLSDSQACRFVRTPFVETAISLMSRTWWEGLLELVGLLGILENKGVEVALAADLELDSSGLLALLDASRAGVLAAADLNEGLDIGNLACCEGLATSNMLLQHPRCSSASRYDFGFPLLVAADKIGEQNSLVSMSKGILVCR